MTGQALTRSELKAACLALLDATAIEHPAGHQGRLAARYLLRTDANERVGLMFEKGDKTQAHLWVESRFVRDFTGHGIESRVYLASALYQPAGDGQKAAYGRHAALQSMRDLAHADLVRFTISEPQQLQQVLEHLAGFDATSKPSAFSRA